MLIVAAIAVSTVIVLATVPAEWQWETLRILAVGLVLMGSFYFPVDYPKPAFVIWWVMLISEVIFFREGDTSSNANAYAGNFPTAAYGNAIGWVLCFLAVLICTARVRGFFRQLIQGDSKWVTLFAVLALGSCAYTPRPALGLVWAFKLTIVALLLLACSLRIKTFRDTTSFLRFTMWAYAIIVLQPVIVALLRNDLFDEEGRMSTVVSPNALSPNAGVVLVLALTLFSKRKDEGMQKSAIVLGIIAVVIMILAGSKTGILAAVVAGTLFFLFRGRFGSAVGYIAATMVLTVILVFSTPLGDYAHLYQEREGAESFSGRTILWKAVAPAIAAKPILGHGYVSTEFLAFQLNAVGWAAPHLHNGFLEALYNNGVLGLAVLLAILLVIPVNLYRLIRRVPSSDPIHRVGAGLLALYAFLLINGFFNSSYGGKATPPFMLLLSLVVVSHKLLEQASSSSANGQRAQLHWQRPQ